MAECPACGKSFEDWDRVARHMRRGVVHHNFVLERTSNTMLDFMGDGGLKKLRKFLEDNYGTESLRQ